MTFPSRWLPRAALAACSLAAIVLATDLLSAQGRRGAGRMVTEMVDGHEVVAGEVLLRFRDARRAELDQASAEVDVDADEVETVGKRGLRRLHSRRHGTRALLAILRANPEVELVEPNYVIRVDATPNDSSFNNLWGLLNFGQIVGGSAGIPAVDISATLAWDTTTGSRANVVGVVDTGIDYNHPDLAANIWSAPTPFTVTIGGVAITCAAGTHGFNAITNTCNPMDDNSHGTHVAGTIGAVGNNSRGVAGVNWTASMMALKFLSSSGSGSTSNAIKLIDFAIQAKAIFGSAANVRVLSNSWGGGGYSQSLKDAIDRANAADMLFVAAAGNDNTNNDATPHYPSNYASPNLVSVAATDNRDQRASFSNYGATSVHLGAPGVNILSTTPNNTYAYFNGTSMATPHVAGAAALVLANCQIPTGDLKTALLTSVDLVAAMAGVTSTGGRLNVNNALRACRPRVRSVVLTTDLVAPQEAGTLITWTATPTGGVAPYTYKWWVYDGQAWTMVTDWTSANSYAWRPATSGTYLVGVWVRGAGNTANVAEVPQSMSYAVVASTRVNSASLSANLPSPQAAGTTVTWTALPAGGIAPYQYKWWTFDGTAWSAAAGWTAASTFAWTPTAIGSNYNVRVWVRSAGNAVDAPEASATSAPYAVIASTRVTAVTLSPNVASPQLAGTTVTWTAVPTGGAGPHQYKWIVFDGVAWTFVTGWTTQNTWPWTPTTPRDYRIGVWVKSAGNAADAAEIPLSVPYTITLPPRVSSVSLSADKVAPQLVGTTVNWTAAPTGGTAPYQYQWWVFNGLSWTAQTGWTAANTLAWTPVAPNLQYAVRVAVRSNGNSADAAEAEGSSTFAISAPPVSAVALSANRAAPAPVGTTVTWTAVPTGGLAPYQYKWLRFDGSSWTTLTGWGIANTLAWTPMTANPDYQVRVWVRSAGNSADAAEAAASVPYAITSPTVTTVLVVANRVSPQAPGTPVVFTATPSGGIAPHQYKWWIYDGVGWQMASQWTATNTLTWTPAMAGTYAVGVWAKSAGNLADAGEAVQSVPFTIAGATPPVVSQVTLAADRGAPQPPGTTITWTAGAIGGTAPYEFKFALFDGTAWSNLTAWTAQNSLAWTPALANAGYQVRVWARSAGNAVDAPEASRQMSFAIGASTPRVTAVALAADRASGQPAGTVITWTATPTGGNAPHQYKWWIYDGVSWTMATGWTTTNTLTWTPSFAGNYLVGVWVKSAGNPADEAEVPFSVAFFIQ